VNGRIAGTWKRTLLAKGTIAVALSPLRTLNKKEQAGVARAIERYGEFLGRQVETTR